MATEINMTEEMAGGVAIRHTGAVGYKVQISADQPRDPKSRWGAFASNEGLALGFFAGKSFANRKTAERAAIQYLEDRAAGSVPVAKVAPFVASTGDDVIQHNTVPAGFSW